MTDFSTVFVSGKIYWAKVLGSPVNNYEGTGREWTYDFVPDDVEFLKEHRLLDRLKEDKKGIMGGDFLHLKKPELDSDGEKNDPIRVYNSDNEPWDTSVSIGNGSKVDLKLTIADWGKGRKKSIWTKAIRVQDLVPYVSNEFGAMDADKGEGAPAPKTAAKKPKTKRNDDMLDMDDEIPF